MTSIRKPMPGRPPVGPFLHGIADWEPRTSVAWREEVEVITNGLIGRHDDGFSQTLLDDYPLKPHELLSDRTDRVLKELEVLQRRLGDSSCPVWVVDNRNEIKHMTLRELFTRE
jgi:CRISPR-associated endonuclease/helicase Cas3